MKNGEQPINPITEDTLLASTGLTKREYFAGLAMQGVLSHNSPNNYTPNQAEDIIRLSVNLAD